jgi:hypothetical protein
MPLGGGAITQFSSIGQVGGNGGTITDGAYLYYANYKPDDGANMHETINIATGEKTIPTLLGDGINSSQVLTTDGLSIFYVPSTRVP